MRMVPIHGNQDNLKISYLIKYIFKINYIIFLRFYGKEFLELKFFFLNRNSLLKLKIFNKKMYS